MLIDDTTTERDAEKKRSEGLSKALHDMTKQKQAVEAQRDALEQRLTKAEQDSRSLRTQLEAVSKTYGELETQHAAGIATKNGEIQRLRDALRDLHEKHKAMAEDYDTLKGQLDEEDQLNRSLTRGANNVRDELAEKSDELRAAQAAVREGQRKQEELHAALGHAQDVLRDVEARLRDSQALVHDRDQDIKVLMEDREAMERRLAEQGQQVQAQGQQLQDRAGETAEARKDCDRLRTQLARLRTQLANLVAQREADLSLVERQLKGVSVQLADHNSKLEASNDKVRELRDALSQRDQTIKDLQDRNARHADLSRQVAELQGTHAAQLAERERALDSAAEAGAQLQKRIAQGEEELEGERDKARSLLLELQQERARLEDANETAQARIRGLVAQLEGLNEEAHFKMANCRIYVAKYDYEPKDSSPNDEHAEELPLVKGQLIRVYGDIDNDGFFHGESLHCLHSALVPSNFVREVPVDCLWALEELTNGPDSRHSLREAKKRLEDRVAELERQLVDMALQTNSTTEEEERRLRGEIESLRSDVAASRKQLDSTSSQLRDAEDRAAASEGKSVQLSEALAQSRGLVDELHAALDTARRSAKDGRSWRGCAARGVPCGRGGPADPRRTPAGR